MSSIWVITTYWPISYCVLVFQPKLRQTHWYISRRWIKHELWFVFISSNGWFVPLWGYLVPVWQKKSNTPRGSAWGAVETEYDARVACLNPPGTNLPSLCDSCTVQILIFWVKYLLDETAAWLQLVVEQICVFFIYWFYFFNHIFRLILCVN